MLDRLCNTNNGARRPSTEAWW